MMDFTTKYGLIGAGIYLAIYVVADISEKIAMLLF